MSRTLEFLDRLVSHDTVSAHSNLALIDWVQAELTALGFRIARFPSPDGTKAGLFAQIGPEGPGVILSGHTDVVPVTGQAWTCAPFRLTRRGARVHGRGTTDMKGFVAAMMSVAEEAAKRPLAAPLKLVLSYDEEVGCVGIQQMAAALRPHLDARDICLVGEPTELQIATGHKGKTAFRAVFHGEAGHSALAPRFANALHLAADFLSELRAFQDSFAAAPLVGSGHDIPYATVHAGVLQGGQALNIVPERAEMRFELRHMAQDNTVDFSARMRVLADRVLAQHHPRFPKAAIELDVLTAYPGLEVAADAPVVAAVQAWVPDARQTKVAFGTEAGVFAALGVPTVVCGPGSMEGQGHKADEYIDLAQLEACDTLLHRALATLQS